MALPESYDTSSGYFHDCLSFLKSVQWLYNYSNIDILVKNVLSNFPPDWISYINSLSNEEFNRFPLNDTEENCPIELKNLLTTIESLKPKVVAEVLKCDYKECHNSGISTKKVHEIVHLAPHVDNICKSNKVDFVIDVGSGLGYLSHLLSSLYKYPVLGIECSTEYVDEAYRKQQKYYPELQNYVIFLNHFIDKQSCDVISEFSNKYFKSKSACIMGLHACADLSITILEIFRSLDFVKCLIIMPCCYHRIKLQTSDNDKDRFENFPLSSNFKKIFDEYDAETFLRRPFLRLSCQQSICSFTNMTEDEHINNSRSLMFRTILQKVVKSERYTVRRLKRKSGFKSSSNPSDSDEQFELYLKNLKNTHNLEKFGEFRNLSNDIDETFLEKMREKWREHKGDCVLVEALTGLQAAMQGICENLVLLDRVEFLREKGLRCFVRKVTDDEVSPRCYALVAVKD